jgi:orotate phosphoribosyltransferase
MGTSDNTPSKYFPSDIKIFRKYMTDRVNHEAIHRFIPSDGQNVKYQLMIRNILFKREIMQMVTRFFLYEFDDLPEIQITGVDTAATPIIMSILANSPKFTSKIIRGFSIRKESKGYGLNQIIEGIYNKDIPTIVVDDVINSGSTINKAINICKYLGMNVTNKAFAVIRNDAIEHKDLDIRSIIRYSDVDLDWKTYREKYLYRINALHIHKKN